MKEPTVCPQTQFRRLPAVGDLAKDAEDRDKLDKHMKQLDLNEELLLKRYTNGV